MLKSPRIAIGLFLILYVSFCGCERAESPSVPDDFDARAFYRVVEYALENYFDRENINRSRSFIGASEAALRSLPHSLFFMSREFYENRARLLGAERVMPGRAITLSANDSYVIFVPDYPRWQERVDRLQSEERARQEAMTPAQRAQEATRQREKDQATQRFIEQAWDSMTFGREDFEKVLTWIELNKDSYSQLPESYRGQDPYKDDPFAMKHVFFAAANGFLQAMDPHSSVLDRESWNRMREEAEDSTFEGIGALLRGGGQQDVIVETPLPGSPALMAGLRAGDIIRRVDQISIENLPLSDVVARIRGPRETTVVLEVERTTELRVLEIPITRGVIVQTAVSSRLITSQNMDASLVGNRKIGVIKVSSFLYVNKATSTLILEEYEKLLQEAGGSLDGLVIDLRGNPGGFLPEAVAVSDLFLPPNEVVVQVRGAGEFSVERTERPAAITGLPIIIMIDSGSASASEIVGSALMDHNVGLIVGERSFGKATVQGINPLGSVLIKLTSARYYAPRGYTIQVHGVVPDIAISSEEDNSFPPRFREEDMWKHLPELVEREDDPARSAWVARIRAATTNGAAAERYIQQHRNDALKTDYMLVRALPFFGALESSPRPSGP